MNRNELLGQADNNCFAVKDANGNYYCGYNQWNPQLRKAKFYHWYSKAKEIADDIRFVEHDTLIVRVSIQENGVVDYES